MDPVDIFAAFTKRAWLIKRKWRSTGAPPANACWPTRKWSAGSASGAAARSCSKVKSQWMLKITEYAQRLVDDLDTLDFIDRVKVQQKNWIGRSTGAEVTFSTTAGDRSGGVHHQAGHPLWRHLYGHFARASLHRPVGRTALHNMDEILAYQRQRGQKIRF